MHSQAIVVQILFGTIRTLKRSHIETRAYLRRRRSGCSRLVRAQAHRLEFTGRFGRDRVITYHIVFVQLAQSNLLVTFGTHVVTCLQRIAHFFVVTNSFEFVLLATDGA